MEQLDTMVDIETLDTTSTAVVISIGATIFNPYKQSTWDELPEFHIYLNMDEQLYTYQRTTGTDTLSWWAHQTAEARQCLTATPRVSVVEALQQFKAFTDNTVNLWGNGSNFDNTILRNLWKDGFPFPYYNDADMRTIKKLTTTLRPNVPTLPNPPGFIKHNALHDAKIQALRVQHWIHSFKESHNA